MAADVFNFIIPPCSTVTGLPVAVEESAVVILTTDGKLARIQTDTLTGLAHYVVSHSPFQGLNYDDEVIPYVKKLEIKESDRPAIGFPYHFTEDVIFVLDNDGQRIVVAEEELGRTTVHGELPKSKKEAFKEKLSLSLPVGLSGCKGKTAGTMPVRLSTDKIQILEMIADWEKGFKRINDLAERTDFYPRPHMFDQHDRVGFFAFEMPDNEGMVIPLRFQVVNGKEFGFQGETFFGGGHDRLGPRGLPMELLSTELKFHFLRATFVGNLQGMSMGASYYAKNTKFEARTEDSPKDASSDTTFNHYALIGADWKRFGIQVGPVFPVAFLQNGDVAREIRPRKAMPMVRLSWTGEKLRAQFSAAKGKVDVDNDVRKRATVLSTYDSGVSVDAFGYDFSFFRTGLTWDLDEEWDLGADWIHWNWDYKDNFGATATNFESKRNGLLFLVRRDFGDYVGLSFSYLIEMRNENGRGTNGSFDNKSSPKSMGGALEFLF